MSDKVIVTNLAVLKQKYGAGFKKIHAAIQALIAADKARGIRTRLVALDDPGAMKKLKAPPVVKPRNPMQNKQAIDGVYRALLPDYVLLLGATDVIPHQDLKNPVHIKDNPDGDEDLRAFGDLPYACEAPYSRRPEDFVGPTRVVGRLPDITGAGDPRYLVALLDAAARWKSSPRSDYTPHLAISAAVWKGSTAMSVDKLFGSSKGLQLSPAKGPKWTPKQLSARSHFINCHGATLDSHFFGEHKDEFPVSHDASFLNGKIRPGTVAAVECCYGAELYDPSGLPGHQAGICNVYLGCGAYGYLGSSTIAYGPEDDNGGADLICQFFLRRVLEGASLGRAALEARQEFAQAPAELDPFDLKTLAQFHLLGDPSIHPVASAAPHALFPKAKAFLAAAAGALVDRGHRRRQLFTKGLWLAQKLSCVRTGALRQAAPAVRTVMERMARARKIRPAGMLSFAVRHPASPKPARKALTAAKLAPPPPSSIHVVLGRKKMRHAPAPQISALVAREVAGKIVSVRELFSR